MMAQRRNLIILVVRDFEEWLPSFVHNTYESFLEGDLAGGGPYGWPTMNVYDLYVHVCMTNIIALRSSPPGGKKYIICNMGAMKATQGKELLDLLAEFGFELTPFTPILGHTGHSGAALRAPVDVAKYKHHDNATFTAMMDDIRLKPWVRF